jgi:hypothetical protein
VRALLGARRSIDGNSPWNAVHGRPAFFAPAKLPIEYTNHGSIHRAQVCAQRRLLHGNGLREIAWLVHVAAAANGDVIRKQLQGDDLEQRREHLDGGRHDDNVVGSIARQVVVFRDDGNDDAVARPIALSTRSSRPRLCCRVDSVHALPHSV